MNRFNVSVVLLTSMAAGCIYSVWLPAPHTDRLSGLIDMVEQYHTDSDDDNALKSAHELKTSWDQILHYSILINDLGHAMEITSCIAEITSFAEEGDDELYAACDRAQAQLELFRQMQTPTLWKIL